MSATRCVSCGAEMMQHRTDCQWHPDSSRSMAMRDKALGHPRSPLSEIERKENKSMTIIDMQVSSQPAPRPMKTIAVGTVFTGRIWRSPGPYLKTTLGFVELGNSTWYSDETLSVEDYRERKATLTLE